MKFTVTTNDSGIAKSLITMLDSLITVAAAGDPNYDGEKLSYVIDISEPKQRKATERKGKPIGARVQYLAVLPTLRADANKVIQQNLENLTGTQYGTVYREVAQATIEGSALTKPDVMKRCGIEVASSAERVLGRLVKQGLLSVEEIQIEAASE